MITLNEYIELRGGFIGQEFETRRHHYRVGKAIEQALSHSLPNGARHLILNLPPRFSKTTMVQAGMEWGTGYVPDSEWIYSSRAAERAVKSVSESRLVMQQPFYQEMFPFTKIQGTGRADNFETTAGGKFYAVGSEGQIIGFGAGKKRPSDAPGGAFIWDDPLKAVDARSPTMLQKAQDFYKDTIQTRFNGNRTPLILIMQRLHPEDPVTMLMRDYPGLCHLVTVPALRDDNTAEWPDTKSVEELELMRTVDPFTFWTQYQQQPIQPGGTILREEWWNYFEDREEVLKRCDFAMVFADTAAKKNPKNDHSVIQVWGFEGAKRMYLLEQTRGKWEFPDLVPEVKRVWSKWREFERPVRARSLHIEDKSSGISLIQTLQREGIPAQEWAPQDYDTDLDKVSRAKDSAYLIYGEKVWLPDPDVKGNEWVANFVHECSSFTADDSHLSDDQVDTMTMAVLTWKDLGGGR